MNMLSATGISYGYSGSDAEALTNVSIGVRAGELVAVMGGNGSGKSTLARIVSGSMEPLAGEVLADGMPLRTHWHMAGLVRQDPQSQLVSEVVYDEISFGLRYLGVDARDVDQRVKDAANACGLARVMDVPTSQLSGGELQRLALAGILVLDPSYLVLDEATSQLDTTSRRSFFELIRQQAAAGKGVLVVTHYLVEALQAHRVVVMHDGTIAWEGTPQALLNDSHALGLACVDPIELELCAGRRPRRHLVDEDCGTHCLNLDSVCVTRGTVEALKGATAHVGAGITLVAGRSGSGKTTLALCASGLLSPKEGSVSLDGTPVRVGEVGLCMQRPEDQLFCESVLDDVQFGPRNMGLSSEEELLAASTALERLGIEEELWQRHPLQLSGGEQRRIAIAGILAMDANVIVLDEPTAGLDGVGRSNLREILCEVARLGKSVVVVSHDIDEWLPYANGVVLISEGRVVFQGPASEIWLEPKLLMHTGHQSLWEQRPVDDHVQAREHQRPTAPLYAVPCGVKVVFLLALTALLFLCDAPVAVGIGFCLACMALLLAGMNLRSGLRVMRRIAVVLAFAWVANALVLDGSADIPLVGNAGISSAGVVRGTVSVVRIVTLALLAAAVAHTTTAAELAHALLAPLRPLQSIGVSIRDVELSVAIALRYIPSSIETFTRIANAQLVRLAPLRSGNVARRLRSWGSVLVPMLVSQMHQADELASALKDRGMGRQNETEGT